MLPITHPHTNRTLPAPRPKPPRLPYAMIAVLSASTAVVLLAALAG